MKAATARPRRRAWARLLALVGIAVVLGASAVGGAVHAQGVQPRRPGQDSFIRRATFLDGRLWLLSDAGVLSRIDEGADARIEEALPEPAVDMCVADGALLAVAAATGAEHWTLRRRTGQDWSVAAVVKRYRDETAVLDCAAGRVSLLTNRRLIDLTGGQVATEWLSGHLDRGVVAAVHGEADWLFVGFNAGEWGGGLQRIDRRNGAVRGIAKNATGELCGGPLNRDCDPVHAVAASPWTSGCVVAAVGLEHLFSSHGRLVEVCGTEVRQMFEKPHMVEATEGEGLKPAGEVAFYGLVRRGDRLWAVGMDGLYRFDGGAEPAFTPLPKFREIGGVWVSFDLPDLVLVVTEINNRVSTGGAAPMLVAR